jgi:CRISPR-associated protein Cas1
MSTSTLEHTTPHTNTSITSLSALLQSSPIPTTQAEYDASNERYEKMSVFRLRNADTVVLGGFGVQIKVRNDALSIECQDRNLLKMHRGVHKIKQIVFFSHGRYISLDALEWCIQQGITVLMLDYTGEVLQVLTPKQPRNARLTYLQYGASQNTPLSLSLSIELIRRKTLSQMATLEKHPALQGVQEALMFLEDGLHLLHQIGTIRELRSLEGRLAVAYFSCFLSFPIKWEKRALNVIPEHWLSIAKRSSELSYDGYARHATNPYHAVLNFALALLKAQVMQSIHIACLSPDVGFLHTYEWGKNGVYKTSLVFDLMEPFRPLVDDLVFSFFQKTTFKKGDFFQEVSGEVHMSEGLKKYVIASCRVNHVEVDRLCRWLRSTLESS